MNNSSEKRKKAPAVLVSLSTMLTAPYVLLIVLSITAVGVISFLNGQAAVNDVAHQLGNETSLGVNQHLVTFLSVPHQINQMNAYAIQNGELNLNNTSSMQQHFLNQALVHPSITSVYFGSSQGGLVGGGREGADGSLYVTITENLQSGDFQKFGLDARGNIVLPPLVTVPNFDARTRPWYVGAIEEGRETWSDIYILFTGQDTAIAASSPVYDGNNNLLGVVSVDIFLSQLSKYLETLSISPSGQVFIMERSGALVATSTGETLFGVENNNGIAERLYARDSQSAAIRQSESLLVQKYGDLKNIPTSEQQFEFTLEGEKQFMQFQSVRDPYGIDWIVVVVIPESAFMERINKGNTLTIQLIIITLIIAVATSVFFTSKITNRIQELDSSAQSLALGEWGRELDTSTHIAELNRLAVSFNQMKEQLGRTLDTLTNEVEERKRAEERTYQIANELQVTLDTVTVGISHIKNRKIEWANAAHDRMFGYPIGETRGVETSVFYLDHESFQKLDQEIYPRIMAGETFSFETELRKRDGTRFWGSLTGHAVNLNRPEDGVIWMLQDITERKQTEQTLEDEILRRRILFEESPDGILVIDPQTTRFLEFNSAAPRQLGYTREEFAQLSIRDVEVGESLEETRARIANVIQTGRSDFDTLQRTRQGEIRNVHVTAQVINIQGVPVYYCIWRDITDYKHAEEALRESEARFRAISETAGDYIFMVARDGSIRYTNEMVARAFVSTPEALVGKNISDLLPADTSEYHQQILKKIFKIRKPLYREALISFPNSDIWLGAWLTPLFDNKGEAVSILGAARDITERKRIEEELREAKDALEQALERESHLARTDDLTGIKNRRHMFELAELKFSIARRYKQPLTMIMFDIDHFKKVNDTWGHVVGDQILIKVTQVVLSEMRNVDLLGRYGGEEFIILSPMTNAQQAYALAERIRTKVESLRMSTDKGEVSVTVSLGIVEMCHDSQLESVEDMFNRADEAMYSAKQAGRNCTKILGSE